MVERYLGKVKVPSSNLGKGFFLRLPSQLPVYLKSFLDGFSDAIQVPEHLCDPQHNLFVGVLVAEERRVL